MRVRLPPGVPLHGLRHLVKRLGLYSWIWAATPIAAYHSAVPARDQRCPAAAPAEKRELAEISGFELRLAGTAGSQSRAVGPLI